MRAYLKNYRQSPRKVRLVADLIRGKDVSQALTELRFVTKRAAYPMEKLIQSAVANAKDTENVREEDLYIKDFRVDQGVTLGRWLPRAFGRATPINKRTSNITIILAQKTDTQQKESSDSAVSDEKKTDEKKPLKKEKSNKEKVEA